MKRVAVYFDSERGLGVRPVDVPDGEDVRLAAAENAKARGYHNWSYLAHEPEDSLRLAWDLWKRRGGATDSAGKLKFLQYRVHELDAIPKLNANFPPPRHAWSTDRIEKKAAVAPDPNGPMLARDEAAKARKPATQGGSSPEFPEALRKRGYTEEELERDNPYNQGLLTLSPIDGRLGCRWQP